jgi:salicylate hydroxylase
MARRIVDREGEVADALKEFEGWHPQICEIIRSVDATNRWALYDRDPLPRWTVGRVTLIGDAAHPMLPYMAQGAVQSIEDAAVLAKCLELADAHDVTAALQRYEQTQASRIAMPERLAPQRRHVPSPPTATINKNATPALPLQRTPRCLRTRGATPT